MPTLKGIEHACRQAELTIPPDGPWDPATFERFCAANPDLHCELDSQGNVVLMSPANARADGFNVDLLAQVAWWARGRPASLEPGPELPELAIGFSCVWDA